MRISDWSSDVCSSDLLSRSGPVYRRALSNDPRSPESRSRRPFDGRLRRQPDRHEARRRVWRAVYDEPVLHVAAPCRSDRSQGAFRSEEHTSELQSLMRTSYAVLCLKKKKTHTLQ